jgi:Flp pilus assembly protein TadG
MNTVDLRSTLAHHVSVLGEEASALGEEGSATLEFIMLAIPLFIPLALFLASVSTSVEASQRLQTLARQAARAFVTSPSEDFAPIRAHQVLDALGAQKDYAKLIEAVEISIQCQSQPCLTPDSRVTIEVRDRATGRSAVATQIVDAWRDSG